MHHWRLIIGAVNFRFEQIVYLFKPCVCFPAHCLQIVLQMLVACGVGLHVLNHYHYSSTPYYYYYYYYYILYYIIITV